MALKGKRKAACTAALSAKRRKAVQKRKADKMCAEDASRLVGDARETESEHRARHPVGKGWEKVCVRCEH